MEEAQGWQKVVSDIGLGLRRLTLSRLATINVLGTLLMFMALAACQSPGPTANPDSGNEAAGTDAVDEIRKLQTAPRASSGGGITRGAPTRQPDGSFKSNEQSETYKDIPAILNLIDGEEDLEKFQVLLILVRDVDFSVYHAATTVMETRYGFKPVRPAITVEERLAFHDAAATWWHDNRSKLRWDKEQQRFSLVR